MARCPIRPGLLRDVRGSALLEFAITLPLLVVLVVGIYDFSGAFNQKQKIAQAAQEGAIVAGAQPMTDIAVGSAGSPSQPTSLLPVATAVFNSLAGSGVLPNANQGTCLAPTAATAQAGLTWTYTVSGCASIPGNLVITINRGWTCAPACAVGPPESVGTVVGVQYPYNWQFNTVIQLLIPGANYAATTQLMEHATVHNQL
jgi:Flp pilus assembly protein TadG